MANILDYLDWRGDLTFEKAEFNEVDNLILAQLVYVDFDGIVPSPESGERITVKEAAEIFFEHHTEDEILAQVAMTKTAAFVLKKMGESKRFANAKLYGYVNDISKEEQSQFSVVCVALGDRSVYVAFSGTDNTIIGWQENFNMGFLNETPGQLKAKAYLDNMIGFRQRMVRVGGHSKGGNLSVYAAVKCKPSIKKRILAVYNNDGPGFRQEFLDGDDYKEISDRIKTVLPESSIVGLLLCHEKNYEVVQSTNSGVLQHDAMSWEVLGTQFVYLDELSSESMTVDNTIKTWLKQLDAGQRQEIVQSVFSLLEEANIHTIDDFYHSKWKAISDIMKAKSGLPEESQKLISEALKSLWKIGNEAVRHEFLNKLLNRPK